MKRLEHLAGGKIYIYQGFKMIDGSGCIRRRESNEQAGTLTEERKEAIKGERGMVFTEEHAHLSSLNMFTVLLFASRGKSGERSGANQDCVGLMKNWVC